MSLEHLTQAVGPKGDLCRKWCDRCDGVGWYEGGKTLQTNCEDCGGTGEVWDELNPIVQALLEKCTGVKDGVPLGKRLWMRGEYDEMHDENCCRASGYVPRPHAEAVLRLRPAIHAAGYGRTEHSEITDRPRATVWKDGKFYPGTAEDVDDALAAAIESKLRAEKA